MNNSGTGLGHSSALVERSERERIVENYTKRARAGEVGTHSLGVEFRTVVVEQDVVRSEDINEFHANI